MPATGFVSTGHLPAAASVAAAVREAHARFRGTSDGSPSTVYPALGRADPDAFGICLVDVDGESHAAGAVDASTHCCQLGIMRDQNQCRA